MPRKKRTVQKQRRQKIYNPNAMSGDAMHLEKRGVFRLFSNYRLFAIIGAVAIIGGLAFSAVYRGQNNSTNSSGSPRGSGVERTTPEAGATAGPQVSGKRYNAPPPVTIDANKTYFATFKTAKGNVKVQLLASQAPTTVNNFVFLAKDGFYNNVTFHRVIRDFVAQGGDPTGTGFDGPGYDLPVERTDQAFTTGILAMAKPPEAGAANNGSQFFFTLADEPTFAGKFTAFGRVVEGMDVLQSLTERDPQQNAELSPGDRIDSIEIQEGT